MSSCGTTFTLALGTNHNILTTLLPYHRRECAICHSASYLVLVYLVTVEPWVPTSSVLTVGCVTTVPQPSTCPAEPPTTDPLGRALRAPAPTTASASSASPHTDTSRSAATTP